MMEKIQNNFNIHPLAMEDILHTIQRPNVDDYQNNLFIV
jgi:magnesium transporter